MQQNVTVVLKVSDEEICPLLRTYLSTIAHPVYVLYVDGIFHFDIFWYQSDSFKMFKHITEAVRLILWTREGS